MANEASKTLRDLKPGTRFSTEHNDHYLRRRTATGYIVEGDGWQHYVPEESENAMSWETKVRPEDDDRPRLVAANRLLWVIHQDSGKHTEEVGFVQSCTDAENLIRKERPRVEQLEKAAIRVINTVTRVAPDEAEDAINALARLVKWRTLPWEGT